MGKRLSPNSDGSIYVGKILIELRERLADLLLRRGPAADRVLGLQHLGLQRRLHMDEFAVVIHFERSLEAGDRGSVGPFVPPDSVSEVLRAAGAICCRASRGAFAGNMQSQAGHKQVIYSESLCLSLARTLRYHLCMTDPTEVTRNILCQRIHRFVLVLERYKRNPNREGGLSHPLGDRLREGGALRGGIEAVRAAEHVDPIPGWRGVDARPARRHHGERTARGATQDGADDSG